MENMGKIANGVNVILLPSSGKKREQLNMPKVENKAHSRVTASGPIRTPPLKPPKKHRSEDTEILRCKRRLDFARLGLHLQRPNPVTVSRRNERERKRVKQINNTFVHLRNTLPDLYWGNKNPVKVSKVDTLRAAIDYIHNLQNLIEDHDAVSTAIQPQKQQQQQQQMTVQMPQQQMMTSPGASSCASSSRTPPSDSPLSPEEQELLEFASWFQ